jgi:hypothetical protein
MSKVGHECLLADPARRRARRRRARNGSTSVERPASRRHNLIGRATSVDGMVQVRARSKSRCSDTCCMPYGLRDPRSRATSRRSCMPARPRNCARSSSALAACALAAHEQAGRSRPATPPRRCRPANYATSSGWESAPLCFPARSRSCFCPFPTSGAGSFTRCRPRSTSGSSLSLSSLSLRRISRSRRLAQARAGAGARAVDGLWNVIDPS